MGADHLTAERPSSWTRHTAGCTRSDSGRQLRCVLGDVGERPAERTATLRIPSSMMSTPSANPLSVVAAADGRIAAIQDSYGEQQSGRPAAQCHNNYVWIAHPNGEWTNYSHVARNSVAGKAKLKVGDEVKAGAYLGDEGAVGCAMLEHVHFEVAVPDAGKPIDAGGFLLDNTGGSRERSARFCGISGPVKKDSSYRAAAC